jgi:hypothetical protein
MIQLVGSRQHGEEVVGRPDAFAKYASEIRRFQQPVATQKPEISTGTGIVRYGQSFARPFARRALMTLRPPLVAMRARNPWVRLRRRLLGWNVLFMALVSRVFRNLFP